MATVYEIIQGLHQAAANAYDGAVDEAGKPVLVKLKREDGDPLIDRRVMDGFGIKIYGNMLCINYHAEIMLKEVYAPGFEAEVERQIAGIASFLKKEYSKITGGKVTLKKEGEVDILVENSSRIRSWVTAKMHYKVGGLDDDMQIGIESTDRLDTGWKKFLDQGGWNGKGGKRPQNDTRKKEKAK